MALNFRTLLPQIDSAIDHLADEFNRTPAMILTEDDLKCLLYMKLVNLPDLRRRRRTREHHIYGTPVHAEVSWFNLNRRLCIKPDITIIEPENLSIVHGIWPRFGPDWGDAFSVHSDLLPLPSKEFEFMGKAVTFELKFARNGANDAMLELIRRDFRKMMRLFEILDRRGEGDTLFSYLIVFDRFRQSYPADSLAKFLREHSEGPRHKIVYKAVSLRRPKSSVISMFS